MKWILILLILFSVSFVSADFGYNNLEVPQLIPEINYSNIIVNLSTNYSKFSEEWITTDGILDDVSDISHSWLNGLAWSVAGHTIDTNIDFDDNNASNVWEINLTGGIGSMSIDGAGYIKPSDGTAGIHYSDNIKYIGWDVSGSAFPEMMFTCWNGSNNICRFEGDILVDENITANAFIGDGSYLTGVGGADYQFTTNNFNGSGTFTTTKYIELTDAYVGNGTVDSIGGGSILFVDTIFMPSPTTDSSLYYIKMIDGSVIGRKEIIDKIEHSAPPSADYTITLLGSSIGSIVTAGDYFEIYKQSEVNSNFNKLEVQGDATFDFLSFLALTDTLTVSIPSGSSTINSNPVINFIGGNGFGSIAGGYVGVGTPDGSGGNITTGDGGGYTANAGKGGDINIKTGDGGEPANVGGIAGDVSIILGEGGVGASTGRDGQFRIGVGTNNVFNLSTNNLYIPINLHQEDDNKHYFGDVDDASIYYDITDLIINPREVGIGDVKILGDLIMNNNSIEGTHNIFPFLNNKANIGDIAYRFLKGWFSGLDVKGDINQTAGNFTGNQIYGGIHYHNHTATELTFSADVYHYLFMDDADFINGFSVNNIGFGLNSSLTAQVGGLYQVIYSAVGSGQNNHVYITSVFINDTQIESCDAHKKLTAGGDIITMNGNCFIRLEVGNNVSLRIENEGNSGTGDYYGSNLNLVRIGN